MYQGTQATSLHDICRISNTRTCSPGDNTQTLSKDPPFRFEVSGESPMASVDALVISEGVFVVCGGPHMVPLTKGLETNYYLDQQ